MPFTVARTMHLPSWDERVRRRVKRYWEGRGVIFVDESDHLLVGKRGHLINNLVSNDPGKLISNLTLSWMDPDLFDCVMVVSTKFQYLTEWNRSYLKLEMATFESYLYFDDKQEDLWEVFLASHDIANLKWMLTAGAFGNSMSDTDKAKLLPPLAHNVIGYQPPGLLGS